MSTIITINGLEQNIGVSSTVLTLSEKLNFYTKKSTCIVELDYDNPTFSYILEKAPIGTKNIDNLFPFINDNTVVDDNLLGIVTFNVQSFKNSNIDVLYGSKKKAKFESNQLNAFIAALRQKYENIVIDYGNKIIPDILMDNSDMNILIVQPTNRYIESLSINRRDYINKKTHLLINNNSKGTTEISLLLKDRFKETEVLGQLPTSDNLVSNLLKGSINIEVGDYNKKLTKIALKICKYLSMEIKIKNSLTQKILSKTHEREEEVFIEEFEKLPLGEILVRENICKKEDIDRCLKIQSRRLG